MNTKRIGRNSILFACSALLFCGATSPALAATNTFDSIIISVNSYNIQGKNLSDHGGGPALAEDLRRNNPDVVGLQETEEEETTNLSNDLGLPYHYWKEVNNPLGPLPARPEGIGIVSRYPLSDTKAWKMPDFEGDERDRYVISAVVDVNGSKVLAVNTHTSHRAEEQREREEQSRFILETIAAERAMHGNIPAFLTGDFNARPNESSIGSIREAMTDTWAQVHPAALSEVCTSGKTSLLPQECGETSPGHPADDSDVDHKRIDYIFTTTDIRVNSVDARYNADRSDVSDHVSINARLSIPSETPAPFRSPDLSSDGGDSCPQFVQLVCPS